MLSGALRDEHSGPDPVIRMEGSRPWRCPNCARLLLKGVLVSGSEVETKCPKCKTTVRLRAM